MKDLSPGRSAVVAALLLLHAAFAWEIIEDGLTLRPDSAEFIIGARALATGHGYVDLSEPDHPSLTRPVGTSLILAPVAAAGGYELKCYKATIIGLSTLLCLGVYTLARHWLDPRRSAVVLALATLHPVTLHYAWRVISEEPFACLVIWIVILVVSVSDQPISRAKLISLVALTLLAEKTRSHGLVLWPALALWTLARPDKSRLLKALAMGVAASLAVEFFTDTGSSSTSRYLPYLNTFLEQRGLSGLAESVFAGVQFYVGALLGTILPNAWPEFNDPRFSVVIPPSIVLVGGMLVLAVAMLGLFQKDEDGRRDVSGVFVLAFVAGSVALLALWPHRMGRLALPLIPLILVLFWTLVLRKSPRIGLGTAAAVLGLQLYVGFQQARYRKDAQPAPVVTSKPIADWIAKNTKPWAQIASDEKRLYLSTGRFVRFTFAHDMTISQLNAFVSGIASTAQTQRSFGATHLYFRGWNSEPILLRNPAYRFEKVPTESALETLWEAKPNEQGVVARSPVDVTDEMKNLQSVFEQGLISEEQWLLRKAKLLLNSGRLQEAEEGLRQAIDNLPLQSNARSSALMQWGDVLVQDGRVSEAIDVYQSVLSGYNADLYLESVTASIAVAKAHRQALDPQLPAGRRVELLTQMAQGHAALGRWNRATSMIEEALTVDADALWPLSVKLFLHRRFGERQAALETADRAFEILAHRFPQRPQRRSNVYYQDVYGQVLLMEVPRLLLEATEPVQITVDDESHRVDPDDHALLLHNVRQLMEDGTPGRALELLRHATDKHPQIAAFWSQRGQLHLLFGQFEQALMSFEKFGELAPGPLSQAQVAQVRHLLETTPVR